MDFKSEMIFDDENAAMERTLQDFQARINLLQNCVLTLAFALFVSCINGFGLMNKTKDVLVRVFGTVAPFRTLLRHDHADLQHRRQVNANSAAFNFQTRRGNDSKEKIADSIGTLREDEAWVQKRMEECTSLDDQQKKRTVLCRAIRSNCEHIVQSIPWTNSCFPDQLVQTKTISETECEHISGISTGQQNKLRTLLLMILKRDFRSLLSFMTCTGHFNPTIKQDILQLMETGEPVDLKCPRCQLKERVNLNQVVDKLFGADLITSKVYSKITTLNVYTDPQGELWDNLLDELLMGDDLLLEANVNVMVDTIDSCGFYSDIVEMLRGRPTGSNFLKCKCGPQMMLLKDREDADAEEKKDSGLSEEPQLEEPGEDNLDTKVNERPDMTTHSREYHDEADRTAPTFFRGFYGKPNMSIPNGFRIDKENPNLGGGKENKDTEGFVGKVEEGPMMRLLYVDGHRDDGIEESMEHMAMGSD